MKDMESGYSLVFSYGNGGKISSYQEKSGSSTGIHVQVAHDGNTRTIYRDYGLDRTLNTSDDILTYYLFDDAKRTVNAYTTDASGNVLGASNALYTGHGSTDKRNNRTLRSSSIGVAAQQLICNTGFEFTDTEDAWTTSDAGVSVSTTNPRTGLSSLAGTLNSAGISRMDLASLP